MIDQNTLSAFTLPCIPNHATREVTERAPWLGEATSSPKAWGKNKQRAWEANPTLQHLFYGAFEGDNPTVRTSKENEPRMLRAVVADYDCYALSDETLNNHLDDLDPAISPAWVSRSHSGGVHAIWILETPVWCGSADLRKRLMGALRKHLKLAAFLPSLDEKALLDGMLYYEAGTQWQSLESCLVSNNTIAKLLGDSASKASFKGSGVAVPLEVVAEEVEARYPGRWVGAFEEGARGCRFWDDAGDALSCIVKPEGILCYTGETGFRDWASLFGSKFVEKYVEDRIGGAAESAWFDGREYWIYSEQISSWRIAKSDEMTRKLKVEYGLDSEKAKGAAASEIDKAMHHISTVNIVVSAAPFVQRKPGILYVEGKRHLNTSSVKACEPADGDCGPDDFPWIENFLELAFVQNGGKSGHSHDQLLMEFAAEPQEQLYRFLAWLKRAYVAGLEYRPAQGQVLILAGKPGCGKTLMADVLIGGALGAKKDASAFLLGESKFSKALYHAPCWVVNDAVAASDPGRKARYNSLVKKVAANREFEMEAKFVDAVDLSWQGRLIITCNVDPESIQVMPQLDSSMADKILALRCDGDDGEISTKNKRFGNWEGRQPDQNILRELPYFLAWLLKWEPPAFIRLNPRFGYESYAHLELAEHAASVSYYAPFEEVLKMFLEAWFAENEEIEEWVGTATQLIEAMQDRASPVANSAKKYDRSPVGKNLANLGNRGKCLTRRRDGYTKYVFERRIWCGSEGG